MLPLFRSLSSSLFNTPITKRAQYPLSRLLSANIYTTSTVNMTSPKQALAKRLEGTDKNVWVEFGKLAAENNAVSMGQGFPDYFPPDYVREALKTALLDNNPFMMQYTRSYGHPRLVNALAKTFDGIYNRKLDPMTEILVTIGAYQSLFCAVQGFINPGDEAIIIEPYFDCYEPMVKVASGKPVFVPLRPTKEGSIISSKDWKLDPAELASKFNAKTKLIFLNNPNNPVGKVYTREELEMVAELCRKHDVICIADEVYEWMVFGGSKHIKIATLPGMWDRTITIGSAGKTFSVTGWKLGWSIGPKHLIHVLSTVHQNCVYTCPTPIQEAVAIGFETELARLDSPQCYFHALAAELQPKRDLLVQMLTNAGLVPTVPDGSYFLIADFSKLGLKFAESKDYKSDDSNDYKFVKWLTINKKLATIPPSAFYSQEHKHFAKDLVRFCFIKEDETIRKAGDILKEWREESK